MIELIIVEQQKFYVTWVVSKFFYLVLLNDHHGTHMLLLNWLLKIFLAFIDFAKNCAIAFSMGSHKGKVAWLNCVPLCFNMILIDYLLFSFVICCKILLISNKSRLHQPFMNGLLATRLQQEQQTFKCCLQTIMQDIASDRPYLSFFYLQSSKKQGGWN